MGRDGAAGGDRPAVVNGIVAPDYAGACVSNIVPALQGRAPRDWLPPLARDSEQVVLFVIDGLGWQALAEHRELLPTLAAMEGGAIGTVVPSTTSTVLTSITTGAAPAEHGIVGLRMLDGERTLHVLRWLVDGNAPPPDPERFQPVAPFGGRPVPVVTRSHFRKSGFTIAHLRGVRYFGWFATSTLVERCRRLVAEGETFVYAYYDGVDHLAHVRGLNDGFYHVELAFADRLAADLLDVLPSSAALLVTADHGQVHLDPGAWTQLPDDVAGHVRLHAGDARFRFLYAKAGEQDRLLESCRDHLSELAWVYSREELMASGLLGRKRPVPDIAARIGDVVLAARAPVAFIDPAFPEEVRLRSGHGSITADEMLVPLLAARGRAR
jgi:hypothetical protein